MKAIQFTEDSDFIDYFFLIKKRKYLILSICLFSVIISLVYSANTKPLYEATAQLLIERKAPKALDTREIMNYGGNQWDFYRTQYELLKDRSLAKNVIRQLHLENSEGFLGKKSDSPSWVSDMVSSLKKSLKGNTETIKGDHTPDPYSPLIDIYLNNLKVDPILNSRLVNISFQGHNPSEIQDIINTMALLYIKKSIDLRNTIERDTQIWLTEKAENLKQALDKKEKDIQGIKESKNIKALDRKRKTAEKKIEQLIIKETEINFRRSQMEGLIKELKQTKNNPINLFNTLPDSIINDDLIKLKNEYFKLKREDSDLSKELGPKHPQMIATREQLKNIEKRIPKQIDDLIESKLIDFKGFVSQEISIANELKKYKKVLSNLDRNYFQYSSIQQDLESDKSLYEMLNKRLKEINISSEYNESNIRLVYPAEMPRFPIKPNKRQNLLFGLFGGLLASFIVIYILEFTNRKLKSIDDVPAEFGCPLFGVVSLFDSETLPLPTLTDPDSMFSENFRVIAAKIIDSAKNNSTKVLLVTSSTPEEGKTTVTSNLAQALAHFGQRVMILDADFRRPNLHNIMKVNIKPGLSQILESKNLKEIAANWRSQSNPALIPAGIKSNNPAHILNSPNFKYLIKLLRNDFDFILIDSPPILNISDTSLISKVCDEVLFILKSNVHDKRIVKRAFNQLFPDSTKLSQNSHKKINYEDLISNSGNNSVKLMGIIMNQYDYKNENYYGYRNYYGKYAKDYFEVGSMTKKNLI